MNLAEIRKKAQQAKETQQLPVEEHEELTAESFPYEEEFPIEEYPVELEEEQTFETVSPPLFENTIGVPPPKAEAPAARPDVLAPEPEVILNAPELPDLELVEIAPLSKDAKSSAVGEGAAALSDLDPIAIILKGREQAVDEDSLVSLTGHVDKDDGNFQELLCFRVASEEYALNIMEIKEIIKPRDVTEVPRVPTFVSGVLSLRGIIIPIFDMTNRLGLTKTATSGKERIIVVKHGVEGFCGILVDEVVQVVRIETKHLEPPPTVLEGIDRDFVSGIGRFNGRMLILLNMEKILDITLF